MNLKKERNNPNQKQSNIKNLLGLKHKAIFKESKFFIFGKFYKYNTEYRLVDLFLSLKFYHFYLFLKSLGHF